MKKFGQKGYNAAHEEMDQLHKQNCFTPILIATMTASEKKKAMNSLIFLVEKRDRRIKARTCANGSIQREWMTREESASPTAALESIMLTGVIDAIEERDVATVDIPNAFIQTEVKTKDGEDRVIMKITGVLIDMLVQMNPELYGPCVIYEKGRKVI